MMATWGKAVRSRGFRSVAGAAVMLAGLPACTVMPEFSAGEVTPDCQLFSREVSLDYRWLGADDHASLLRSMNSCSGRADVCFATYGVIVAGWTAGSALVSGSVYLAGNTVHWLEYQGRCSGSELRQTLSLLSGGQRSGSSAERAPVTPVTPASAPQ